MEDLTNMVEIVYDRDRLKTLLKLAIEDLRFIEKNIDSGNIEIIKKYIHNRIEQLEE